MRNTVSEIFQNAITLRRFPEPQLLVTIHRVQALLTWNAERRRWTASTIGHVYPRELLSAANLFQMKSLLNDRLIQKDMQELRGQAYPLQRTEDGTAH